MSKLKLTMRNILFLFLVLTPLCSMAHEDNGGISPGMLERIERAQPHDVAQHAIENAMASTAIDQLAFSASNKAETSPKFMYETVAQNIQDQQNSGRCWCFTGLNVLRGQFAKIHQDTMTVEFSRDYLYFYDQLEKANLMLQGCIETASKPMDDNRVVFFFKKPLHDGGTFCGVIDLIRKYGIVPSCAQPETYQANNNKKIMQLLNTKLRMYGLELRNMVIAGSSKRKLNERKTEMLATIYHILALAVGTPVKTFTYTFKNKAGNPVTPEKVYTPQEFFRATVGELNYDDYIMVMNDPRRPYYKTYRVVYARHLYDGHDWKYLNLPMRDIEDMAVNSIKDGIKMYFSVDSEKQRDNKKAYCDLNNFDYNSLFGTSFNMPKADRIRTYESGSTHAMTLTAVDIGSNGRPTRWKAENTFGSSFGSNGGYVIMTNDWFEEYVFRLVALKKYASQKLTAAYAQKPIDVMPEDPLFGDDK